jgi:hypothetical protein
MKKLNSWLSCGTVALLPAAGPVSAQNPPCLDLHLFAGVNITGISHGFWLGKHEVAQGEYLDVAGSNPSQFTGDLNRPVESVSWLDATNYCALLTAQQIGAGLIPPGSQYAQFYALY